MGMKLVWSASQVLLGALAMAVYVASLSVASKAGVEAMVATTLLPGISQAYWIATGAHTGMLPQPLTFLCEVWLLLLAVSIYARDMALRSGPVREAR
jgi:hypothetical protein